MHGGLSLWASLGMLLMEVWWVVTEVTDVVVGRPWCCRDNGHR